MQFRWQTSLEFVDTEVMDTEIVETLLAWKQEEVE